MGVNCPKSAFPMRYDPCLFDHCSPEPSSHATRKLKLVKIYRVVARRMPARQKAVLQPDSWASCKLNAVSGLRRAAGAHLGVPGAVSQRMVLRAVVSGENSSLKRSRGCVVTAAGALVVSPFRGCERVRFRTRHPCLEAR